MISNIQVLRAFAAINVVLFHIILASKSYLQDVDLLNHAGGWGASGVDIFFVISGFVMLHTQMVRRLTPLEFFKNRTLRIVPIYWTLSLFVILLYLTQPSIFRDIKVTPTWAISSLFFTSSIFANQPPIVHVGWTLEWEMYFYLVFAISLFFRSLSIQLWFVAITLVCTSLFTNSYIVLEFLFGMVVAYAHIRWKLLPKQGVLLFMFGTLLLLFSLLPSVATLQINRVLLWGIPAILIVLGLISCSQANIRLLTFLGDASYSIYLVQIFTISAFYKFSSKYFQYWNGDVLALLCLISSVSFGCLVYSLVERPLTVNLKRMFKS